MEKRRTEPATYKETVQHYQELRAAVFEFSQTEFSHLAVTLSEISYADTVEANGWKLQQRHPAAWDWERLYREYHSRGGARRFDLAVKAGGQLAGLCYGMLERDRLILKLHAAEASPERSAVRRHFVDITLFCATAYANLVDASELWLCNPVSDAHTRLYSALGFEPQSNAYGTVTHLITRLKP